MDLQLNQLQYRLSSACVRPSVSVVICLARPCQLHSKTVSAVRMCAAAEKTGVVPGSTADIDDPAVTLIAHTLIA